MTPNRSDCLSMIGVAYEDRGDPGRGPSSCRTAEVQESSRTEDVRCVLALRIEAPRHARIYAARLIKGVSIGPSPQWMQNRLIGCRHSSDQQHRRYHQLRDAGIRPAAARIRRGRSGRRTNRGAACDARGNDRRRSTMWSASLTPQMLVIADRRKAGSARRCDGRSQFGGDRYDDTHFAGIGEIRRCDRKKNISRSSDFARNRACASRRRSIRVPCRRR